MGIREIIESWITDIISSALGIALIVFSLENPEIDIYHIALIGGILMQIPTFYFVLWKNIKKYF